MSNSIYTAPVYKMQELNNLFIEMTAKNCNQRCANCYIDFPMSRNAKDFISLEKIKEALNDTKNENVYIEDDIKEISNENLEKVEILFK